jgi:hypothetical protein
VSGINSKSVVALKVFSLRGQVVYQSKVDAASTAKFLVKELSPGAYIYSVRCGSKDMLQRLFIIKE